MTCMVEKRVWDWLLISLGLLTGLFFFFSDNCDVSQGLVMAFIDGVLHCRENGDLRGCLEHKRGHERRHKGWCWKQVKRNCVADGIPERKDSMVRFRCERKSQPRWWLTALITKLSSHWRQWKLYSSNEDGCLWRLFFFF